MISNRSLITKNLFRSLNPEGWPIKIADLPFGSALVGGSVRDGLLNKLNNKPDLDFVLPVNAVKFSEDLAKRINATFVKLDKDRDIARIAVNGWTLDFAGQIGTTLVADLLRRDYRINAIALILHEEPRIVDPAGGIEDLNRKKIVAISEKNLIEDPLRILRGFRLMCELNFDLEENTKSFIKANANLLNNIAPERIKTEILKIINSNWHYSVWETYLELDLLKNWHQDKMLSIRSTTNNFFIEELIIGRPLARLICLLSDEGLSRLTFSRNQMKRCKNLRFWVHKINNFGLENLTEDERFQLHIELGEDLPSLILFLQEKYTNEWIKRWRDPSDPLFHPSPPLDGHSLQKAFDIPSGPSLGELIAYLSKERAFGRLFTKEEALKASRKWALENSPFL